MTGRKPAARGREPGAERLVACPTCGKPAVLGPSNRWRPFCGERCRLRDLGAWASESYRIPAKPGEGSEEDR